MFTSKNRSLWLACGCTWLAITPAAHATLGEPLPGETGNGSHSSQPQRKQAQAATPYVARTTTTPEGLVLTEYATVHGVVFAVKWQGPTLPELEKLLGTYFPTFRSQADASANERNVGSPLHINHIHLKLFSGGRMNHFEGYAFDPRLVPSGVEINHVLR